MGGTSRCHEMLEFFSIHPVSIDTTHAAKMARLTPFKWGYATG